jgi:hypothetical protein
MGDFNYASAIEQGEKEAESTSLQLILLGQSGAGKSHAIGTLDVPTLYVYFSGENHGVKAAKKDGGKKIMPIAVDVGLDGKILPPDQTYERLLALLDDVDGFRKMGFKAIALDGATEIEALIRATSKWRTLCLSNKGSHNAFEEPRATVTLFRPILNGLQRLQRETDCHYVMTCVLDVKEYGDSNEVVECSPRLLGYQVAESVVQQFGDIVVVGLMKRDGVVKPKFQMMTDVVKTSKNDKGVVKKTINFSCRITGLGVEKLQPYMPASLKELAELKRGAHA